MTLAENIYEAIHQYTADLAASQAYCSYTPPTPSQKKKLLEIIQAEIDHFRSQR